MIRTSAPLPVTAPPTPIAKYSPPLLVFQRPAALESACKATVGNISLKSSEPTKFLTLRPKPTASSAVWAIWMILRSGYFPKYQAGSRYEANSDFV